MAPWSASIRACASTPDVKLDGIRSRRGRCWTVNRSKPPKSPTLGASMEGKKIKGRKRHVLTDTLGLVLGVHVTTADERDAEAGWQLVRGAADAFPRVAQVWVDGAYAGSFEEWVGTYLGWRVVVSTKQPGQRGFVPQAKRWAVERTFSWLGRWRRLAKNYEELPECEEAHVLLASLGLLLRRVAPLPA